MNSRGWAIEGVDIQFVPSSSSDSMVMVFVGFSAGLFFCCFFLGLKKVPGLDERLAGALPHLYMFNIWLFA